MPEVTSKLSTALADRYRIERRLGEGGMATVFLAEDLKHKRKVALKVLKPDLAAVLGAERFIQEITTTAGLQHPHILPLFDSGEADGFLYYVMPYIEGETLRDKLDRETQLGVDEAVEMARNIADALDYAHRSGVIHRDIKPENILLHDGRPVVADFGIALAVSAAAGGRMTETGLSLGTPHYMSPEQATAEKDLSARSDVYSLASVLYEMLTGEPPHMGNSAQQIIMKIVTDTPRPVSELRKSVPPNVTAAVAKALEKLAADRFESARAFAEALGNDAFSLGVTTDERVTTSSPRRSWVGAMAATAVGGVVVGALLWSFVRPGTETQLTTTYTRILLSQVGAEAMPGFVQTAALAPDGSAVVFADSVEGGEWQLWLKEQGERQPIRLEQRAGRNPLILPLAKFSPDGQSIAFFDDDRLKRVARSGGTVVTLSDSALYDGAWLDNETIVATSFDGDRVYSVPARGGPVDLLFENPSGVTYINHLSALPGGNALLFTTQGQDLQSTQLNIFDINSGEVRELLDGPNAAWYVASGHIVFSTMAGDVFAVSFDLDSREIRSDAVPVLEPVRLGSETFLPDLEVTPNGTALYVPRGGSAGPVFESRFVWTDRTGATSEPDTTWRTSYIATGGLSLSPDGTRVAYNQLDESGRIDIYVKPLPDRAASRLTFEGTQNVRPEWSPRGDSLMFVSNRLGSQDLWVQRADGAGSAHVLVDRERPIWEGQWSPDGQWIIYRTGDEAAGRGDILAFRPGRDSTDIELVATEYEETSPRLSPDGKWLAYTADAGGRKDVYVRPFPNVNEGRWQVSNGGGTEPLWLRDGRALVYRSGTRVMVAEVTTTPAFSVGAPQMLFSTTAVANDDNHYYAVSPDGQRFLFAIPVTVGLASVDLVLVQNFLGELDATFRR